MAIKHKYICTLDFLNIIVNCQQNGFKHYVHIFYTPLLYLVSICASDSKLQLTF